MANITVLHRGNPVGYYNNKRKAYYTNRFPQHFFRKFQGFGVSADIIKKLIRWKCEYICFIYLAEAKSAVYYWTTIDKILVKGTPYYDEYPFKGEKHDKQYILSVKATKESNSPKEVPYFPPEIKQENLKELAS